MYTCVSVESSDGAYLKCSIGAEMELDSCIQYCVLLFDFAVEYGDPIREDHSSLCINEYPSEHEMYTKFFCPDMLEYLNCVDLSFTIPFVRER